MACRRARPGSAVVRDLDGDMVGERERHDGIGTVSMLQDIRQRLLDDPHDRKFGSSIEGRGGPDPTNGDIHPRCPERLDDRIEIGEGRLR